jgi:hypothetical protein
MLSVTVEGEDSGYSKGFSDGQTSGEVMESTKEDKPSRVEDAIVTYWNRHAAGTASSDTDAFVTCMNDERGCR